MTGGTAPGFPVMQTTVVLDTRLTVVVSRGRMRQALYLYNIPQFHHQMQYPIKSGAQYGRHRNYPRYMYTYAKSLSFLTNYKLEVYEINM